MSLLTIKDRFILQNFFDTQPKRREQYLKERGFQMNPNDDGQYRPIGSNEEWRDIDPGISGYTKGSLKDRVKELGADVGDVSYDLISGIGTGIAASLGLTTGATVGAATGPAAPAMVPTLGALGFIAGGGIGNVASETIKKFVGDVYLKSDIPMDKKDLFIQSAIAGLMPAMAKGATKVGRAEFQKQLGNALTKRIGALTELAKMTDGRVTDDLMQEIVAHPEKFEDANKVKNAFMSLNSEYEKLFGLPSTKSAPIGREYDKIPANSIFGSKKQALIDEQTKILSNSKTTINPIQLKNQVDGMIKKILSLPSGKQAPASFASSEQEAAIKYLKGVKSKIDSAWRRERGTEGALSFEEFHKLIKTVQDDAYNREIPGGSVLRSFTGGDPDGFLKLIYSAGEDGKKLSEVNSKLHSLSSVYDQAQENLKPNKFLGAFTSGRKSRDSITAQETLKSIDQELGTDLGSDVKIKQYQVLTNELLTKTPTAGSRNFFARAAQTVPKKSAAGALATTSVGAGYLPGAVAGGLVGLAEAGKYATPADVLPEIIKTAKLSSSMPSGDPLQILSKDLATRQLTQQAAQSINAPSKKVIIPPPPPDDEEEVVNSGAKIKIPAPPSD